MSEKWTQDIIPLTAAGTLYGMFRERVRRTPHDTAYFEFNRTTRSWQSVTWEGVAGEVARWQTAMRQEGLQAGDRVAVLMRNCVDWVVFDQAALGLGLVVVPLYVDDRPDSVAYIVADAGARLLLVQDAGIWRKLAPALDGSEGELRRIVVRGDAKSAGPALDERVRWTSEWLPEAGEALSDYRGDPHELASIVYTSGTTGRPKGVMLSHHNMLSVADAALRVIDVYQQDTFLSFLPLSHTLERTAGYYLPIITGSTVAYSRSILELADDLATMRPTVMIAVPRIFERVYGRIEKQMEKKSSIARALFHLAARVGWHRFEVQQGRAGWSPKLLLWPLLRRAVAEKITSRLGGRLRLAVSGGAALPLPVARMFIGLGVNILQGYGLTETSPVISVNTEAKNDPASVGLPLPGIEVRIGEHDELLVKTPGAMLGYWGRPEATAEVIDEEGWLHTGDQVRIENGFIYITGRIKDILVLSNGENVPPGDLESNICLDPLFEQALVLGEARPYLTAICILNPEEWGTLVVANGKDPAAPDLIEDPDLQRAVVNRIGDCLRDFPGYAKVRRVILSLDPWTVENGMLTPTLKTKRKAILDHYADRIEAVYAKGPAKAHAA
ncbi:MAG: AMP-dependent synthetase/ligase [Gammaproteobacteria bacterium]